MVTVLLLWRGLVSSVRLVSELTCTWTPGRSGHLWTGWTEPGVSCCAGRPVEFPSGLQTGLGWRRRVGGRGSKERGREGKGTNGEPRVRHQQHNHHTRHQSLVL